MRALVIAPADGQPNASLEASSGSDNGRSGVPEGIRARLADLARVRHPHLQAPIMVAVDPPGGATLFFRQDDGNSGAVPRDRPAHVAHVAIGLRFLHAQSPPVVHGNVCGGMCFVSPAGKSRLGGFGLAAVGGIDARPTRFTAPELVAPVAGTSPSLLLFLGTRAVQALCES